MSESSEETQLGHFFKVDYFQFTHICKLSIVNYHCLIQFSSSRWVNELGVYLTSAGDPSDHLSMHI